MTLQTRMADAVFVKVATDEKWSEAIQLRGRFDGEKGVQRKYNPNHSPVNGRFTSRAGGSGVNVAGSDEEFAFLKDAEYKRVIDPTTGAEIDVDEGLVLLMENRGFYGKPTTLEKAEFNRAEKLSLDMEYGYDPRNSSPTNIYPTTDFYRGIQNVPGVPVEKMSDSLVDGSSRFHGVGTFGNGLYFSPDPRRARGYAGDQGMLQRMALKPDAKVITKHALVEEAFKLHGELGMGYNNVSELGRLATWLGYDVIHADDRIVVLNHSKLIIDKSSLVRLPREKSLDLFDVELKFNPYHSSSSGRFVSGPAGDVGGSNGGKSDLDRRIESADRQVDVSEKFDVGKPTLLSDDGRFITYKDSPSALHDDIAQALGYRSADAAVAAGLVRMGAYRDSKGVIQVTLQANTPERIHRAAWRVSKQFGESATPYFNWELPGRWGEGFDARQAKSLRATLKYNPNHDDRGRFASGGGGSIPGWETAYRGHRPDNEHGVDGGPIFLTNDRSAAEYYAEENDGVVSTYSPKVSNPAKEEDLQEIWDSVGEDEMRSLIQRHSPYDGDNMLDALYVPKVRQELESRGFDSYVGWDALTNDVIDVMVVWDPGKLSKKSATLKFNPNHDRRGRFAASSGGRDLLGDDPSTVSEEWARSLLDQREYGLNIDEMSADDERISRSGGDVILSRIVDEQWGGAGTVKVADLGNANDANLLFRGVEGSTDYHTGFINGDRFMGKGVYGNGIYFAQGGEFNVPGSALFQDNVGNAWYKAEGYGSNVRKYRISSSAKIVDWEALTAEHTAWLNKTEQGPVRSLTKDPGRYAALKGYDGIKSPPKKGVSQYVIFNRGVLEAHVDRQPDFSFNKSVTIKYNPNHSPTTGRFVSAHTFRLVTNIKARVVGFEPLESLDRRTKNFTLKYNPNHDARGRFASGEGRRLSAEEIQDITSQFPVTDRNRDPFRSAPVASNGRWSSNSEDLGLKEIARRQGFDGLPTTGDVDALIRAGQPELFRAFEKKEHQKQFREGDVRYGEGKYGAGIYTSINGSKDRVGEYGKYVERMTIKPDARVISIKEIYDSPEWKSGFHLEGDPGRWAAVRGYDAVAGIFASANARGQVVWAKSPTDLVILNRSALVISASKKSLVVKYNPNHDSRGRFSSGGGSGLPPAGSGAVLYRSIPATWTEQEKEFVDDIVRQIEDSGYSGLGHYWGTEEIATFYGDKGSILYAVEWPKDVIKWDDINGSLIPANVPGRLVGAWHLTNSSGKTEKLRPIKVPVDFPVFSRRTDDKDFDLDVALKYNPNHDRLGRFSHGGIDYLANGADSDLLSLLGDVDPNPPRDYRKEESNPFAEHVYSTLGYMSPIEEADHSKFADDALMWRGNNSIAFFDALAGRERDYAKMTYSPYGMHGSGIYVGDKLTASGYGVNKATFALKPGAKVMTDKQVRDERMNLLADLARKDPAGRFSDDKNHQLLHAAASDPSIYAALRGAAVYEGERYSDGTYVRTILDRRSVTMEIRGRRGSKGLTVKFNPHHSPKLEDDMGQLFVEKHNPYHDERGRFASARGYFSGGPVNNPAPLTKAETGRIGEEIAMKYLGDTASTLNVGRNNYPIDFVSHDRVVEVKTGLSTNPKASQQWRATIGQPGKKESEWLKTATAEEKRAWNNQKRQAILERKQRAVDEVSQKLGRHLKPTTLGVIIDPHTREAHVYEFEGFHLRIGWSDKGVKEAYRASYKL